MFITIGNKEQAIISTNYWESEYAEKGLFFLSWNAGAARLLIPDSQKMCLREMKHAREVVISRGPWEAHGNRDSLEIMWEDDSDNPFTLTILQQQSDRIVPVTDCEKPFAITAWTRKGLKNRWLARYRVVDRLPCMQPWRT